MRLLISRSLVRIADVDEFFKLILIFLIAIYRAAFCRVLASVCETKLRLCVKKEVM